MAQGVTEPVGDMFEHRILSFGLEPVPRPLAPGDHRFDPPLTQVRDARNIPTFLSSGIS